MGRVKGLIANGGGRITDTAPYWHIGKEGASTIFEYVETRQARESAPSDFNVATH